jgi:hypothetical protein
VNLKERYDALMRPSTSTPSITVCPDIHDSYTLVRSHLKYFPHSVEIGDEYFLKSLKMDGLITLAFSKKNNMFKKDDPTYVPFCRKDLFKIHVTKLKSGDIKAVEKCASPEKDKLHNFSGKTHKSLNDKYIKQLNQSTIDNVNCDINDAIKEKHFKKKPKNSWFENINFGVHTSHHYEAIPKPVPQAPYKPKIQRVNKHYSYDDEDGRRYGVDEIDGFNQLASLTGNAHMTV